MKQKILNILKNEKRTLSKLEISNYLEITNKKQYELMVLELKELVINDVLKVNSNNEYSLNLQNQLLTGIIQLHSKGFGFIKTKDNQEYFVKSQDLNGCLDMDEVLFATKNIKQNDARHFEARVIEVLKRPLTTIVATVCFNEVNKTKFLKINNIKLQHLVLVVTNLNMAIIDTIVIAKIVSVSKNQLVSLEIQDIIGNINTPGIDVIAVVHEFFVKTKFVDATLNEVKKISPLVMAEELIGRRDLQNNLFITIDGSDAKDLDDAISVVKLDNGNYKLFVAIADVAHYVAENSALDKEAFIRGTSVYLVDRVIAMLPPQLSNGICSLNENEMRLAIVCEMEINAVGETISNEIYPAVIKTKRRMSYDEVNLAFSNQNPDFIKTHPEIYQMLLIARDLHHILRKYKEQAGVIDFNLNEAKLIINQNGKISDITLRNRATAEMLIEDFMIRANETVASTIYWMNLPFIYRIHDKPKIKKLREVYNVLKIMGYYIKGKVENVYVKDLQLTLENIKDKPWFQVVATLFLRSMEKARYDINNIGHFGLASDCYTHFTSPIRRYPDLIVHRMLRKYLFEKQINNVIVDKYTAILQNQAEQSSISEMKALECERAVEQMKKAEYMETQIGKRFSGIVSSVTNFGIFVELENTIEGLVRVSDMRNDYYNYNEKTMRLVGERTRKEYYLGQIVNIEVKHASKLERKIDFILKDPKNGNGRVKQWK
ncbi:ribonuclease R [Spiroplasma endosymbiont of Nephrotoma flavescens]|uniref:ribonuclease R n=1 Tax=Spiroplasma endosymbiont of Nephrotoma flavescens TaxID=3066302 RepID=UPI00313F2D8F